MKRSLRHFSKLNHRQAKKQLGVRFDGRNCSIVVGTKTNKMVMFLWIKGKHKTPEVYLNFRLKKKGQKHA